MSLLESSSSDLPNQPDDFLRGDSLGLPFFLEELDELLSLRRKPSMACPIIRASTIALRPSHLSLLKGDRDSFGFVGFTSGFGSFSLNFSNVTLANETGELQGDLPIGGFFFDIGW